MARAETQPVRLPSDLVEKLREEAAAADRSLPAEVEARLRDSLDRGAWATVEPQLPPRPRAIGRLVGFLANELVSFAPAGKENDYLQHGLTRALARLRGEKLSGPDNDAAMMVDYWWLRMNNAHERTRNAGETAPVTDEQKALREIRDALLSQGAAPPDGDK